MEPESTVSKVFGDVDDIEHEEKPARGKVCESLNRSHDDLQGLCWSSATRDLPVGSGCRSLALCLRRDEADARENEAAAAAAGDEPEGFYFLLFGEDSRELSVSETITTPTAPAQSDAG